jgi:hypothetical protein
MASSPLSSREEGCEYWPSFFARCLWGRSRVVVARVSSPQSETIWSVYETPGDLIRACTHKSGSVIDVRFTPDATNAAQQRNDAMCQKPPRAIAARQTIYSITSSARASSVGGTSRPSALAVPRLMTSSNRVARSTGTSAGLAPLRIRPARMPTRR